MQRRKASFFRNALDLRDRVQVRVLRRRLKVSEEELGMLVRRTGNSIAALNKEIALNRGK
jgi:DNA polymerase III delta subunit